MGVVDSSHEAEVAVIEDAVADKATPTLNLSVNNNVKILTMIRHSPGNDMKLHTEDQIQ